MRLLHFVNSIILILLVMVFSLSHTMPNQLKNYREIPADVNVSNIDKLRFKISLPATIAWKKISKPSNSIKLSLSVLALNGFILSILILFFRRKTKGRLSVNVQGGKVSITVNAIEDSLRRCLKGDPQIDPTKVIVVAGASRIKITAYVTLRESDNLHHLDENIISHMKTHLEKIFPIQKCIRHQSLNYLVQ